MAIIVGWMAAIIPSEEKELTIIMAETTSVGILPNATEGVGVVAAVTHKIAIIAIIGTEVRSGMMAMSPVTENLIDEITIKVIRDVEMKEMWIEETVVPRVTRVLPRSSRIASRSPAKSNTVIASTTGIGIGIESGIAKGTENETASVIKSESVNGRKTGSGRSVTVTMRRIETTRIVIRTERRTVIKIAARSVIRKAKTAKQKIKSTGSRMMQKLLTKSLKAKERRPNPVVIVIVTATVSVTGIEIASGAIKVTAISRSQIDKIVMHATSIPEEMTQSRIPKGVALAVLETKVVPVVTSPKIETMIMGRRTRLRREIKVAMVRTATITTTVEIILLLKVAATIIDLVEVAAVGTPITTTLEIIVMEKRIIIRVERSNSS